MSSPETLAGTGRAHSIARLFVRRRIGAAFSPEAVRLGRVLALGIVGTFALLLARDLIAVASWRQDQLAEAALGDFRIYMDAAHRWLETGQWFRERQLSGPYVLESGDVLYPPVVLWLLVPFALLPSGLAGALWIAIPVAGVAAIVWRHRPAWWSWPILAACLWFWRTPSQIIHGNPVIWVALAVAIGTISRPALALALLKPTVIPFALLGIRSRGWWAMAGISAVASLPFAAATLAYPWVLMDVRDGSFLYSLPEYPLLLMPVIAWAAANRARLLKSNAPDRQPRVLEPDAPLRPGRDALPVTP